MYSVEKIETLRAKDRDLERVLERFTQQLS
jgi:hypothetical protein